MPNLKSPRLDELVERLREAGVKLTAAEDERIALHEEWIEARDEWVARLQAADAKVADAHEDLARLAQGAAGWQEAMPPPDAGELLRRTQRRSIREKITEWFEGNPDEVFGPREIAYVLGCRNGTARVRMHELVNDGVLDRVSDGRFRLCKSAVDNGQAEAPE